MIMFICSALHQIKYALNAYNCYYYLVLLVLKLCNINWKQCPRGLLGIYSVKDLINTEYAYLQDLGLNARHLLGVYCLGVGLDPAGLEFKQQC